MKKLVKKIKDILSILPPSKGFTLLELLIVVLIIGILAAVALPHYRRIIEKSRATEAMSLINAVSKAMDVYYLANNEYPKYFSDLDIEIPWTGKEEFYTTSIMTDFISNGIWSIGLENAKDAHAILAVRLDGYYKGGGFLLSKSEAEGYEYLLKLNCAEWLRGSVTFEKNAGEFCINIMNSPEILQDSEWARFYKLP